MKIVPGIYASAISADISRTASSEIVNVSRSRFPDGEMYLRIDSDLKGEDLLVVSNTRKDDEIIDLMLLLDACRGRNPGSITLLIPFFGYARQHMRYREGEPISSSAIGRAIFPQVDRAFIVEVHDNRAIEPFASKVKNLMVEDSIVKHLSGSKPDYVVSPDDGGEERAKAISGLLGTKYLIMEKKRIDSRTVEIEVPDADLRNRSVVLIDDMISTGGTIVKACSILRKKGVSEIHVVTIHGLFLNESFRHISEYADSISATNTIWSPYSKIDISAEIYNQMGGMK